jgi:hypothetical protein
MSSVTIKAWANAARNKSRKADPTFSSWKIVPFLNDACNFLSRIGVGLYKENLRR